MQFGNMCGSKCANNNSPWLQSTLWERSPDLNCSNFTLDHVDRNIPGL